MAAQAVVDDSHGERFAAIWPFDCFWFYIGGGPVYLYSLLKTYPRHLFQSSGLQLIFVNSPVSLRSALAGVQFESNQLSPTN